MTSITTKTPKPKVSRRKQYSAPALEKGLDILEMLAREPDSMNLKGVADRLNRSVGEIFRMLAVLEQRGYVRTAQSTERYELSMRLFQLAHWHLPVNRLTRAADGPMRRLALEAGQSCHLAILSGARIVVISKHDSFRDRNFSMRVGAESPLFASCSGRIFYALSDGFMRETLLTNIAEEGGDVSRAKETMKLEAHIRADGLLEIPSDIVEGIIDIGTPVFGHDGAVAAALVIPFLHRIDHDNAVQLPAVRQSLIEAARAISSALGSSDSA
jgi:DNA-binding IclR family transcriptional regulator